MLFAYNNIIIITVEAIHLIYIMHVSCSIGKYTKPHVENTLALCLIAYIFSCCEYIECRQHEFETTIDILISKILCLLKLFALDAHSVHDINTWNIDAYWCDEILCLWFLRYIIALLFSHSFISARCIIKILSHTCYTKHY